ncbi:hypothetical protein TNCV_3996951 [Trichonephila clavipes]|nr:hypothetical protein TNCV_3996951 [Trichonephila clavipes]
MTLADCRRPLFGCRMIYRSSSAVVVLGRNDTFVDSELCSYTGDSTPLLQLSDHSSTCEVVQCSWSWTCGQLSSTENTHVDRLMHPNSVEAQSLPVGVGYLRGGSSQGVVLVT